MADGASSSAPITEGAARPLIGLGSGLIAYLVLWVGYALIGVAAQGIDVAGGLWVTEALAIALPAFVWVRSAGLRTAPFLLLQRPQARWLVIAVITGLLNQPVVSLLAHLAHTYAPAEWVRDFDAKNAFLDQIFRQRVVVMTLTVTIAAGIGEEIFFRGFLQTALGRRLSPLWAALLSGALFSAIHLDAVGFVGLWEIGLWLAILRWASGSLWVAILGHVINNLVAASSFYFEWQNPSDPPPGWMLVAGALLLLAGAILGNAALRAPSPVLPTEEYQPSGARRVDHARSALLWLVWSLAVLAGLVRLVTLRR